MPILTLLERVKSEMLVKYNKVSEKASLIPGLLEEAPANLICKNPTALRPKSRTTVGISREELSLVRMVTAPPLSKRAVGFVTFPIVSFVTIRTGFTVLLEGARMYLCHESGSVLRCIFAGDALTRVKSERMTIENIKTKDLDEYIMETLRGRGEWMQTVGRTCI